MITLTTFDRTPTLSELKVSYRRGRARPAGPAGRAAAVTSPVAAEDYLRSIWDHDTLELREEFVLVCLTTSLEVIGWIRLATGGLDSTTVDRRLLLGVALQAASSAILVAHNHPSGSVEPSAADLETTRLIAEGARLVGLRLLDHIILTREASYSMSRYGHIRA